MSSLCIVSPPTPSEETLAEFCEKLEVPLERISNLVFLALQGTTDTLLSKQLLKITSEQLDEVRRQVSTHYRHRVDLAA